MTDEEIHELWNDTADYSAYAGDIERFAHALIAKVEAEFEKRLEEEWPCI